MSKNKKSLNFNSLFSKNSANDIERVVLKCFIRTLKDNGTYMLYRRNVNNTGIMKALLRRKNTYSDNPFSSASSTEDVISTLKRITNDMAKSNGKKGGSKDLDKYEVVTMAINHLLHFFMETNGIAMQKLCELGEEIYSMSCYKLFGDTIEDINKQNEDELSSIESPDQLKAKLFQNFITDLQKGNIPSSMNFDEYVNEMSKSNAINAISKSAKGMGENIGHRLGNAPDELDGRHGWVGPDYIDEDEDEEIDDWV